LEESLFDFVFEGQFWTIEAQLPSWAGYQTRKGPYGSISSDSPSDGVVKIVTPEDSQESSPTEQDRACVQWLLDHEAEVASAVLKGILADYPKLQELYGYEGEERETLMPDVSSADDFRQLIGLHNVHVLRVVSKGIPYLGFEFGCVWDPEHGLGVLVHGTRVVEVGGADTAFTEWIAKRDAGVRT
jgi:hypothetical protein